MLPESFLEEVIEEARRRIIDSLSDTNGTLSYLYKNDVINSTNIEEYVLQSFNRNHSPYKIEKYKELLIRWTVLQNAPHMHPYTCAIDSEHKLLVPRIHGDQVFLICPSCGYMQHRGTLGI